MLVDITWLGTQLTTCRIDLWSYFQTLADRLCSNQSVLKITIIKVRLAFLVTNNLKITLTDYVGGWRRLQPPTESVLVLLSLDQQRVFLQGNQSKFKVSRRSKLSNWLCGKGRDPWHFLGDLCHLLKNLWNLLKHFGSVQKYSMLALSLLQLEVIKYNHGAEYLVHSWSLFFPSSLTYRVNKCRYH